MNARELLDARKAQVRQPLRSNGNTAPPRHVNAPCPNPTEPSGELDEEVSNVLCRFARHGIRPDPDDLQAAVQLERQRAWCGTTLDAAYRGEMTLFIGAGGNVSACQRARAC